MPNVTAKPAIAFYAPLKSPNHAVPSGDRKIARLFMAALEQAGFTVELASQLRSFDKQGNQERQQRMLVIAKKEAQRILRRWRKQEFQPVAWFSYHLYYKAPDLIGAIICQQLNIPYIVAEASWSQKRAHGPWALYHHQVDIALQQAKRVICINPVDKVALDKFYQSRKSNPVVSLPAFIDDANPSLAASSREQVARDYALDSDKPWLVTIAMMRSGDKFNSYQLLAEAIAKITATHQLLIIGDGVMQDEVAALFAGLSQVRFAGALTGDSIAAILPQFEILIWPAVNEALGMIFLEAQQAGNLVIAGEQGGVSSVVDGNSGVLLPVQDTSAMAQAVDALFAAPHQLTLMQQQAKDYVAQRHSLSVSADKLESVINALI